VQYAVSNLALLPISNLQSPISSGRTAAENEGFVQQKGSVVTWPPDPSVEIRSDLRTLRPVPRRCTRIAPGGHAALHNFSGVPCAIKIPLMT
jgi:hypothetical protein